MLLNLTTMPCQSHVWCCQPLNERRHLLRLWVSPPGERPLPEGYKAIWGSTTPGKRGGINIGDNKLVVPLEAE